VAFAAAAPWPIRIDVLMLVSVVVPVPAFRPALYPKATLDVQAAPDVPQLYSVLRPLAVL
jgi:hypothetical protein